MGHFCELKVLRALAFFISNKSVIPKNTKITFCLISAQNPKELAIIKNSAKSLSYYSDLSLT